MSVHLIPEDSLRNISPSWHRCFGHNHTILFSLNYRVLGFDKEHVLIILVIFIRSMSPDWSLKLDDGGGEKLDASSSKEQRGFPCCGENVVSSPTVLPFHISGRVAA